MRDPKSYAKVIGIRRQAIYKEANKALAKDDYRRRARLLDLADSIPRAAFTEDGRTRWSYATWTEPPHWRRTNIIPDNEEEA